MSGNPNGLIFKNQLRLQVASLDEGGNFSASGSLTAPTVTISGGAMAFSNPATTTIVGGANAWTIATSSTAAPIVSISTGTTSIFDNLFAQTITVDTVQAQKLCLGQTCVNESQLKAGQGGSVQVDGDSGSTGAAAAPTGLPDDASPIISINGDNPATINIGDTYSDLGANVSDTGTGQAGDSNLGVSANVDGGATTTLSQINLDTTVAGTHTIIYSATDQNGLTGTATRTVNVVDTNATATDTVTSTTSIADTSTATTTATSTAAN